MKVERPVWLAIAFHLGLTLLMVQIGRFLTEGQIAYALDDAYIHMGVARNLAQYGVWGPTPAGFGAATSSLLWPLLLALAFKITGPLAIWPTLLNLAFIPPILYIVDKIVQVKQPNTSAIWRFLILVVAGSMLPIGGLTLIGMEHLLQVGVTLLFVWLLLRYWRGEQRVSLPLVIVGMIVTATRYEGLFLITAAVILLLWQKRFTLAATLMICASLPLLLFGYYSVVQGGYFLPNSLLVKGNQPEALTLIEILLFGRRAIANLVGSGSLFLLLIVATSGGLLRLVQNKLSQAQIGLVTLFALTIAFHLPLARVSRFGDIWRFRYDAYLIAFGIVVIIMLWPTEMTSMALTNRTGKWLITGLAVGIVAVTFSERALETVPTTVIGNKNIYEQQVQMGRFVAQYYPEATIVLADLGGVSYGGAADVIDLNGLANHRSAVARLSPLPNFPEFERLIEADEAPIAILYSELHELAYGPVPTEWELIGRWRIQQNIAAGSNVVTFFALSEDQALPLRDNLESFASSLPTTVEYALHPDWR